MFTVARLLFIVLAVLTVVYVSVSLYSRSVRRDKLEAAWEPGKGTKTSFVEDGLREYDKSLRRKLILGVYIVPILLIFVVIYATNYA
jgi:hypothetical protein